MSTALRIYLFGGLRLAMGDKTLPPIATLKARSLFAFLVMHPQQAHTRHLLAGLFWPDVPEAMARRRLSQALWRIRRAFQAANVGAPLIVSADNIQFDGDASCWVDVQAFEEALREGRERGKVGERMAVGLYRGDFMDGFYDDWIIPERERLRDLYLDALEQLLAQDKEAGEYEESLRFARQLALAEPLRETAHCEIMRLCRLLDRPQEARHQYETLKDILAVELGIEPSPTATELYRQLILDEKQQPHRPVDQRLPVSPFLDGSFAIPLVGRENERRTLIAGLDAAMQGNGGIALVGGEAGVGKTRLLEEIARDAGWGGMQAVWGWGQDRASVPAYDILTQLLQAALTPLRATQVRTLVDEVWLSALDVVLPTLASLCPDLPAGPRLKPEQEQKRVHEAISRVVLALGTITPHLLILEDVHWATETTLAALLHLAPHLNKSRIFIILSYRKSEAQERATIWDMLQRLAEIGNYARFELPRLSGAETEALVRLGLGLRQPAPRFAERMHRETGGNPLFALEMLRSLHDEGVLYQDESGAWNTPWDATTIDYAELPTPPGVHQVIARRLERQNDDERSMLHAAAILGDRFDFSLASRLVEQKGEACLKSLDALISRGFLEEEPDAYRFSHNLVRRVTLMEMDEAEKRRRHGKAFDLLMTQHPDEIETLAYHAAKGERWRQALLYNRRAGDRARAAYAGDEAIAFYTLALEAWRHLEREPTGEALAVLQHRGEVFQETGRFDSAELDFRAVISLAAAAGDQSAVAAANNSLSYLHFQRGDYDLALEISKQAYVLARQAESEALMARALLNSANALRNRGRAAESIDFYRRAAEALTAIGDEIHLADCLNRMGYAYFFMGQLAAAEEVMLRSRDVRRRLDDKVGLAYSLSNLSGIYAHKGDFERAKEAAMEAYDVASAAGDPYGQDAALQNLGQALLEQGFLDKAIWHFQRAIAIAREIGDNPLVAEAQANMGQAYARKGYLRKARQMQYDSLAHFERGGEIWYLSATYENLAEINLALGDAETARAQAARALDIASELAAPHLLGTAHRVMGLALTQGGLDSADADPAHHFDESIHWLEQTGCRANLARTWAAYGRWLLDSGGEKHGGRGKAMLAQARSLFREMGMAWDLAMLDRDETGLARPKQLSVRLPLAVAPTGRPLCDDEWVDVTWRIATVEDEAIPGKVARRQHRILRLLREAAAQNAAPRLTDLAQALDVNPKTIQRDLAALRAAGHDARTRGSRG